MSEKFIRLTLQIVIRNLIHVLGILVDSTQNVVLRTTGLSVFANQDTLEVLRIADPNAQFIQTVPTTECA
jgi:hypothetical protein